MIPHDRAGYDSVDDYKAMRDRDTVALDLLAHLEQITTTGDPNGDLGLVKEKVIYVQLPERTYLRLHAHRFMEGRSINDICKDAVHAELEARLTELAKRESEATQDSPGGGSTHEVS